MLAKSEFVKAGVDINRKESRELDVQQHVHPTHENLPSFELSVNLSRVLGLRISHSNILHPPLYWGRTLICFLFSICINSL